MMTTEMKNKLIAQLREELEDYDTYEMMAHDYDYPCKQVLMDIAHEEKTHAHHLHDIMKRHNVEVPSELEHKLKNT